MPAWARSNSEAIARENPSAVPRVRVIPNPIDTDIFVPPASGRVARTPGTMLFTGRVHPEKGLHLLIEAWRSLLPRHPGLGLRFVGPSAVSAGGGGDDYIRRLHSVAGDHEIRIDPPVYGRTALADVLREADYFCYPSLAERGETFGVAPLEAMGTGLAPVVSDLTCFRDFLEPGVNGLIFDHRAPDAVTRLSDSLDRLISDPAGAARMGEAAARTAQRFSYSAVAEQFLSDFESLLRDRAGGAGTR